MSDSPLIGLFASKTLARLLSVFLLHSEESFYQQQLVARAGSSLRPVQVALDRIVASGLVTTRREGRNLFYRANTKHPAFADLRSLFTKTFGIADVVRAALEPVVGIESAYIYGSVASGEETASSDIDLLVIGDVSRRALSVALSEAEATLDRQVNATLYDRERFERARAEGNHFIANVLGRPTIWVIGDPDGLGTEPGSWPTTQA